MYYAKPLSLSAWHNVAVRLSFIHMLNLTSSATPSNAALPFLIRPFPFFRSLCLFEVNAVYKFIFVELSCVCVFLLVSFRSVLQCAFASLWKFPSVPPPEVGISPLIKLF